MKSPKHSLAIAAALAGLMQGTITRAAASSTPSRSIKAGQLSDSVGTNAKKEKHGCKGQNSCKGKGGCASGDNGCKGKNSCKGKGGCATNGKM